MWRGRVSKWLLPCVYMLIGGSMWVCMCNLDLFNFSQLNAVITAFPTTVSECLCCCLSENSDVIGIARVEWLLLIIIM